MVASITENFNNNVNAVSGKAKEEKLVSKLDFFVQTLSFLRIKELTDSGKGGLKCSLSVLTD